MKKIVFFCFLFLSHDLFSQEFYCNYTFKFKMLKPNKWLQFEEKAVIKSFEKIELSKEKLDEIFRVHKKNIFLVTFSKYDPKKYSGGIIIPTINISINPNHCKTLKQLIKVVEISQNFYKKVCENYVVIEKPSVILIDNIQCVTITGKFSLKINNKIYTAKSKIYAIPTDNYLFQISLANDFNNNDGEDVFQEIPKNIKIMR